MREGLGSVGATCQVSRREAGVKRPMPPLWFFFNGTSGHNCGKRNKQQSKPKSHMHWRCCRRWQGRSQSGPRLVMVLVPPPGASARSGLNSPVLDTRFFPPQTFQTQWQQSILPGDQPAMVGAGLGCEVTEPAHGGGKGYGLERWRSRRRLAPSHRERKRPREGSVAPQYARLRGPNQRHKLKTNNRQFTKESGRAGNRRVEGLRRLEEDGQQSKKQKEKRDHLRITMLNGSSWDTIRQCLEFDRDQHDVSV